MARDSQSRLSAEHGFSASSSKSHPMTPPSVATIPSADPRGSPARRAASRMGSMKLPRELR
jgi:hypothetical protein